jgi:hypothetical protein
VIDHDKTSLKMNVLRKIALINTSVLASGTKRIQAEHRRCSKK